MGDRLQAIFAILVVLVLAGCGGGGDGGGGEGSFSLSGHVYQNGQGLPGVMVILAQSGTPDRTAVSDGTGAYSFTGLQGGSYDLQAIRSGQTFSANFVNSVTIADTDRTGLDFDLDTCDLTGRVELAGAGWIGGGTVVLTGDETLVDDLDDAGNFPV